MIQALGTVDNVNEVVHDNVPVNHNAWKETEAASLKAERKKAERHQKHGNPNGNMSKTVSGTGQASSLQELRKLFRGAA